MGHEPCEMELYVCLKDFGEHHWHIAICVDDLLIASKYPQGVVDALTNKYHFKLKGTDNISYYL